MNSRRRFLQTNISAAMWGALNLRTAPVMAAFDGQLDTSELPGMDALRWYAQQLTLISPDELDQLIERESREFGSWPFRLNGAYVYNTGRLSLNIQRPDLGHKFTMNYFDPRDASYWGIEDFGIKGHLGGNADTVWISADVGNDRERGTWYGYGGYGLSRISQMGINDGQPPSSQIRINGNYIDIYNNQVLEGIADYDTTRAPLLTGVYEGMHTELMRRRTQIFAETNATYRRNLQQIIHELEKEGKIRL